MFKKFLDKENSIMLPIEHQREKYCQEMPA